MKNKMKRKRWLKGPHMAWTEKNGALFNPLLKYPRNSLCFCDEKKVRAPVEEPRRLKAKHCCLPGQPIHVSPDKVRPLRQIVEFARHLRDLR